MSKSPAIKVSIHPAPKAVWIFAASLPLALLVTVAFPGIWYASLYMPAAVLAFMLADLSMALPGRKLDAELVLPALTYVGREHNIRLKALAQHKHPLDLEILVGYRGEANGPNLTLSTLKNGELELNLPFSPTMRGKISIEKLWLRWHSPFGLMQIRRKETIAKDIDVVPDIYGIHENALQFFARDAFHGAKSQNFKGEGAEFETLCEFAPGMDTRFIDWKSSAKHRKFLAKEFRQERNHQIIFGFDTGHLMLEPVNGMPKLDHAIKAGLLLSWISLYSGDMVGGCGFSARFNNYIKPGRGMPYFTAFQKFSAGLNYHTNDTNFTLGLTELNARLKRRALIILFTEFVDTISAELLLESLQHLTRKHLVVFVTMRDPALSQIQDAAPNSFIDAASAVVASDFLRERAIVLERISRLGVHCLDLPAHEISSGILNRYLLIKQRGLL